MINGKIKFSFDLILFIFQEHCHYMITLFQARMEANPSSALFVKRRVMTKGILENMWKTFIFQELSLTHANIAMKLCQLETY